jgi:hypothetical protein
LLSNNTTTATNTKLNISDTANMLSNRFARDTSNLSARIDLLANNSGIATSAKLNISDTAAMLSNRIGRDTVNLSTRINLLSNSTTSTSNTKLNISDTAAMLSNRIGRDTVNLSTRIDLKELLQNKSTSKLLGTSDVLYPTQNAVKGYVDSLVTNLATINSASNNLKLDKADTIYMSNRIDTKLSKVDTTALLAAYAKKFTKNVAVKLAPGKYLGKYIDGDTIPSKGKTMDEFLEDIATEIVHPKYILPTVVLNYPRDSTCEIGSNLSFTFSSSFTRNDGGAASSTIYQNNGTALGGTSFSGSITSNARFKVVVNYAAGAAKNNNQNLSDTTGQIGSGSVTSNEVQLSVLPKAYWGYSTTNSPNDATIIAGNSAFATTKAKEGFSVLVPTGTAKYVFYAYPSSYGDLDQLYVGGFESRDAFTLVKRNVTNAFNYTQSYNIYISNNILSDLINDIKAK